MDRLIDENYFVGDIQIPNVDDSSILTDLNRHIDRAQKAILIELLGYSLYKEFETALSGGSPATKWTNLRDGADYTFTYNGTTYNMRWEGLKNTTDYISLIAYFSYYYYMVDKTRFNTGDSVIIPETQGGSKTSDAYKLINAWNKGIDLYGVQIKKTVDWSRVKYVSYSDYPIVNATGSYYPEDRFKQSAFNFIWEMNDQNGDDYYDNWVFTNKETINQFGI